MEKIEILILGDCREAVICAKFAKKNYPNRHVGIIVSSYTAFTNMLSIYFNYLVNV